MAAETKIQQEVKDTNTDWQKDKSELLAWLIKLEPKDIVESLNSAENKIAITGIIKTPTEEAIKDLQAKKLAEKTGTKTDLTTDEKDLLVLSAWLYSQTPWQTLTLPDIAAATFDAAAYDKIANDELTRLSAPATPEVTSPVKENLEVTDIDSLKLSWWRNWALAPTYLEIITAVNKITDPTQKTDIKKYIIDSATLYKDWKSDEWSQKVVELQTYLIDTCKVPKLYGNQGGKDGKFGRWTYNAIFNLWVVADTDKQDPMLDSYTQQAKTQQQKEVATDLWEQKEITNIDDIPLQLADFKYKKYIYKANQTTTYTFYDNWEVEKRYKDKETWSFDSINLKFADALKQLWKNNLPPAKEEVPDNIGTIDVDWKTLKYNKNSIVDIKTTWANIITIKWIDWETATYTVKDDKILYWWRESNDYKIENWTIVDTPINKNEIKNKIIWDYMGMPDSDRETIKNIPRDKVISANEYYNKVVVQHDGQYNNTTTRTDYKNIQDSIWSFDVNDLFSWLNKSDIWYWSDFTKNNTYTTLDDFVTKKYLS